MILCKRLLLILIILLTLSACNQRRTYESATDALHDFPGYLNDRNEDSLQILHRQEIQPTGGSGGDVLLYTFEGTRPDEEGLTCLAVTFLSQNNAGRFRAESSGRLGCDAAYPQPDDMAITYLLGGNVRELATVYGLAPGGATVRVTWADGLQSNAPIENGAVLLSRPQTVHPHTVEILDEAGDVVHVETYD